MKVNVWICDKCGIEFRENVVHYEEFDFCFKCAEILKQKRQNFDNELASLRIKEQVEGPIEK